MRIAFLALTLALALTPMALGDAYAADGKGVTVSHPWARATPGGSKISAAFMEISSQAGDKLVSASSPAAGRVEIHTHIMEGDVMKMRRVDALEVAPGKPLVLKPMGDHIMLMDLKEPLKEGKHLKMTLTFEKAGAVEIEAPIQAAGSMGDTPAGGASSGHAGHQHH